MKPLPEFRSQLGLAILAYCGFQRPEPAYISSIRADLQQGLDIVDPGAWEIVWGPASCAGPLSIFDDALVYVARRRAEPHRFSIAIRGTNPVSISDWLLGDFWVGSLLNWPGGAHGERISFSTAYGVEALLHLRDPSETLEIPGQREQRRISHSTGRASGWILTRIKSRVEALRASSGQRVEDQIKGMRAYLGSTELKLFYRLFYRGLDALDKLEALFSRPLFDALTAHLKEVYGHGSTPTLLEFLRRSVNNVKAELHPEISVTGHSKGGALTVALATRLAETQGAAGGWDPKPRATVHAFSFAGPTAGNGAFARHAKGLLGERLHRVVNPRDLVPRGWIRADLREAFTDYGHRMSVVIPGFVDFTSALADHVYPLGYAHPADTERPLGELTPRHWDNVVDQLIYEHLQAYTESFDLPLAKLDTGFPVFDEAAPPPAPAPPAHLQVGNFLLGFLVGFVGNFFALSFVDRAYRAGRMGPGTLKGVFVGSLLGVVTLSAAVLAYVWLRLTTRSPA